jgi:apolipoprotein D and lipocalin family protein
MKHQIYKIFLPLLALFGCTANYPPLNTVKNVDLDRYIGKWYEIAAFPQFFEKDCFCSSAEYIKTDKDYIKVINSNVAEGKAFIVENSNNSKLEVQFFWPFKGDYWIIELADDYSYAVIGHPNRKYLWILSRKPVMEESLYNAIVERTKSKGFDITKLVKMVQGCE